MTQETQNIPALKVQLFDLIRIRDAYVAKAQEAGKEIEKAMRLLEIAEQEQD